MESDWTGVFSCLDQFWTIRILIKFEVEQATGEFLFFQMSFGWKASLHILSILDGTCHLAMRKSTFLFVFVGIFMEFPLLCQISGWYIRYVPFFRHRSTSGLDTPLVFVLSVSRILACRRFSRNFVAVGAKRSWFFSPTFFFRWFGNRIKYASEILDLFLDL